MAKENMEEKKRHNRKIKSVAVGEGLYVKPYRKAYGFFLKKKLISLLPNRPLSNIYIKHFAKKYINKYIIYKIYI